MEGTLGEIRLFAGSITPRGWAMCDGALQAVDKNPSLYSILGITYGGDGRTTFGLPTLDAPAGEATSGLRYIICVQGLYPQRT